ncbi:MAG TPA: glycoside hydrolase family 97 protein [Polyangia bacterium]|jgi:alpha-glucosidase|nr:glycoside hydrolase family 97 protein [Polyangia bacterium]
MLAAAALVVGLLAEASALAAPTPGIERLASPNGHIAVAVHTTPPGLSYDVLYDGKPLLAGATLALIVDGVRLGSTPRITTVARTSTDATIAPPVRQTSATLADRHNDLRLTCAGGYTIVFRAYDLGVAYRFETALPGAQVKITGEEATFRFATDAGVFYPTEESFFSHNERQWKRVRLGQLQAASLASIPAIVETAVGPKVAIAEADLEDYPGLWLRGTGGPALTATFPPYPLEEKLTRDRDFRVTRAADYIAVTRGTRTFPWRVLGIAEKDTDLVGNPLCYLLARPSEIKDMSWIRPGKVAWDWWNALNLRDVPFKPGVNTETYQAYIDFAAQYGLEYIILDEGWYKPGNLLSVTPTIDMPKLCAYARAKHVGVILWAVWKTLADQFEPAVAQFSKWGIAGLKIDFMQRDDQPVIQFYWRVCRALAERKMLVDFHGAIRSVLLTRTWPNLLTAEGVQGLEHDKWSNATEPEHDVTLPFTRMFLGPMDFTPGAMHNADRAHFKPVFNAPMSLGTRCHQLAMYVVYESPLQMLADSPSNYRQEPDAMAFLGPVPSVWDETRVLDGKIGDYVVVARRRGDRWYVGAMTNWTSREIEIDTGFLAEGVWTLTAFVDGPQAATEATDYRRLSVAAHRNIAIKATLAPGGGMVGVFVPRWGPTPLPPQ